MTVSYVTTIQLGVGDDTGETSGSSAGWTGAAAGDDLFLVFTGSYLTSGGLPAVTLAADGWTLLASEEAAHRVTASPFTRKAMRVWHKRATASDLGVFSATIGSGFVTGSQTSWAMRGVVYRGGYGPDGAAVADAHDNTADTSVTWQGPTVESSGFAVSFHTAAGAAEGLDVANGFTLDAASTIASISPQQGLSVASQAVSGTVTGPTWGNSVVHIGVAVAIRFNPLVAAGIYLGPAVIVA